MPTSADLVQIAIVPETIYGTTPATPAFQIVRTTGEGISFAPTTTQSNEMDPDRQITDSILTGGSATGDLNFELAYEPWFETLLEGFMCNNWTDDELRVGAISKSFTIEKQIPVQGGTTQFHRFTGCTINGFTLTIAPNAVITGTFTVLGKGITISETAIAGATYVEADLTPVMAAPRVQNILVDGVPAVSRCFNTLSLTGNNNNRAIECIGTLGAREVVLGRLEVTSSFGVLFTDSTLISTLVDQTTTSLSFETLNTDSDPAGYVFTLPKVKFTAATANAGGTNQDVVTSVTAQALKDATDGTLVITRTTRT